MDDSSQWQRLTGTQRLALALVPPLAAAAIRLLHATLRYEAVCGPGAHEGAPGEGGVWCFWHRCLLPAACYFHHRPKTAILISRSFDGELIARTIQRLGYLTVRGSSSRGGAGSVRALAQSVLQGNATIFPADGPRGPVYRLKPGAVRVAQLAGSGVGSFYLLPQRAWKLRSWDRFLIPKPFSRVAIAWGRVVDVPREMDEQAFESKRLEIEAVMEQTRFLAEEHLSRSR
jgi:lysophospholipid acyltransferase (LPLAT)-like uncharacterized protein